MGKLGLNSGYIGSDQRITRNGIVGYGKYFLERLNGRFIPNVGILNIYPGATAAYSLRRLSNTYRGSILRVRRSSDDAEQNIGFINGELDITTLEIFCSGTNGFVTTWYDQSGNGYDVSQSTSASQPQIVNSGSVITDNGKPSIHFDGVDDSLKNTSILAYPPNVSIFTVFKILSIITNQRFYHIKSSSNNISMTRGLSTYETVFRTLTDNELYNGPITSVINQSLISVFDSDTLYNNTALVTGKTTSTSAYSGNSGIYFGQRADGGNFSNVSFQEFIYYQSDQLSNRTVIETNINNFYNIY